MQKSDPENVNLFTVIQRGDRRIRSAKRKAIILVGLTRIGKSTTFNWILNKPMRGKGKLMSHYVNTVEGDESAAKVGSSYSSVTLAPNVYVQYEEDVSLIDMAGYEDTRNYVGVIGVSYFLKALFEQVRQAKFVVIFDQNKFTEENGSGLIRTFNGFINMFHYKEMPAEVQKKLKSSISVLITKSRRAHQHYQYLDEVVSQLRNEALIAENRETVIQLIQYVRNSARIHPFLAAKDNGNPQEVTFIQNFSQNRGWKYFSIDQAELIMGRSPIALPFDRDFKKLAETQKEAFTAVIEERVKSYLGFSKILETITENFSQNWLQFLSTWRHEGKAVQNHFKLSRTFDKIREFVQGNDVYNSKQSIQNKFRVSYEPMTLIKSIKDILQLYNHVQQIGGPEGGQDFAQAMNIFTTEFSTLVQCMRGFASSNQDQELLQRLKYILVRGFREFSKLYQLKADCIIDAKQKFKDNCNQAFSIDKQHFIEKFVTEFTSDLLAIIFPTIELLVEYQQFFNQYEQKYKELKTPIFFSQQRVNIEMAKADLLFKEGQKNKALHCYISALRNLGQLSVCVAQSTSYDSQSTRTQELNSLSMKKLKLIRRIVSILKGLSESEEYNYKKYALWLCLHHKMIDDACQIYQLIVDSAQTGLPEKLNIYSDYANYCSKWGRVQRGIQILQKKLALEESIFRDYSGTIAEIKTMSSSREELFKTFYAALNDMKRLPENDKELNEQLKEIEYIVPQ